MEGKRPLEYVCYFNGNPQVLPQNQQIRAEHLTLAFQAGTAENVSLS